MIWLIGDKGMLGSELSQLLSTRGMDYFGTDRECDITDPHALRSRCAGLSIEWIVNCSAYTAVDRAEDEEALARRINAEGAGNLAGLAEEIGAAIIHVSTDYVFDGKGARPYEPGDPVAPTGAYGRTKAEGEALVRLACARHFIVRTAWLYGRFGKNFVYTMLQLMKEKGNVGVVDDQRGSPTWARDLASGIIEIIASRSERYGIYHFTDEGETSWFDFAKEISTLGTRLGLLPNEPIVRPLKTEDYPTKTKRPAYSVLSNKKTQEVLRIVPPKWQESIYAFLSELATRGIQEQ